MIVPIRNMNVKKKIPLPDSYPTPAHFNNGDWTGSGASISADNIFSELTSGTHEINVYSKVFESKSVNNIFIRVFLIGDGDTAHPGAYVSNGVYVEMSDDQVTWTNVGGVYKSCNEAPEAYHWRGEFTANVTTPSKKYFRIHFLNRNGQGNYSSGTYGANILYEITFT